MGRGGGRFRSGRFGASRPVPPSSLAPPAAVVLLGTLVLLAAATPAGGQETIASDRPGIGSASTIIDPGVLQAEFGAAWSGGPGSDALSLGQLLVRYGVGVLELELLGNSWVNVRDGGPDGFEDVAVGAKVPLARGLGDRMNLSLQGLLGLPSGSDAFTSDEWIPTVVALADLALGERSAVGLNLGYSVGAGAVGDQLFASVTPGVALTERLGGYVGWAGSFTDDADTHWLEGGLAHVATPDVQLDVNGAFSPDTDRWFIGLGMAVRTGAR